MFLICLSLIGLITVALVAEQAFDAVEKAEFVPIPVRVNETESFQQKSLRR